MTRTRPKAEARAKVVRRRRKSLTTGTATAPESWGLWLIGYLLVVAAFVLVFKHSEPIRTGEPDHFLHNAIAKRISEKGSIQNVPQFEQTSWAKDFTHPYFLFAYATAGFYRLFGEDGIFYFGFLVALGLISLLYFSGRGLVPPFLALLVALALLLTPDFANRAMQVRPHLVAVFLFVCLTISILRENRWMALTAAFLTPLFYHQIFVGIALCLGALAYRGLRDSKIATVPATALGGFLLGALVHPYFPKNLTSSLNVFFGQTLHITTPLKMPLELGGLGWANISANYGFYLFWVALGAALILPVKSWGQLRTRFLEPAKVNDDRNLEFLFLATAALWCVVPWSFRITEYALPLTALLAFQCLRTLPSLSTQIPLAVFSMVFLVPTAYSHFSRPSGVLVDTPGTLKAVRALPENGVGKRVFNCDWTVGAYMISERPSYHLLDFADPRELARNNPILHDLRSQLTSGHVADPYGAIKHAFKADYVVCSDQALVEQIERNPNFRRIHPDPAKPLVTRGRLEASVMVYELAKGNSSRQVRNFERGVNEVMTVTRKIRGRKLATTSQTVLQWKPVSVPSQLKDEERSRYLNLRRIDTPVTGDTCAKVRPAVGELAQFAGAKYLGIGGGPKIRVWRSGTPLFNTDMEYRALNDLSVFVPLDPPLRKTDRIEVEICSDPKAASVGLAVSLWTEKQVNDACRWKFQSERGPFGAPVDTEFKYAMRATETCLAPIASRTE